MSKPRTIRCDRIILDFCRSQGFTDFEILTGKKHRKLYLDGRMAAVISHGNSDHGDKGLASVFSVIKRAAKAKNA